MITIGIDSGTQSTKAIALDVASGEILATHQQAYDLIAGLEPGHLEQDPADWIAALEATIQGCLAELGELKNEVAGIGVSGQQHGLVACDADGNPVRAAKLWCDTSTTDQCSQFEARFGGAEGLIGLAGNAIPPGFTIPKLLWLKQHEPENFAKTEHILLPHDYLNYHLTGVRRMEYGDASGTGVLDIATRKWRRELLDFVDPRAADMFPEVGSSLEPCGPLRPELAAAWGLNENVVVSAGGGDNMIGAIGTGNLRPGTITASFGTSGTLYACADSPVIDPKGEVAAFCDSTDRWLPLVCTMNVTVVTEAARGLFGMELPDFEKAVGSIDPGADGLTFLPYLNGERTPNLPSGSGVLHGLRADNMTPAHLARAAMEGATLGLAYGLQRFRDLGIDPKEIRLTGGGSKSATWRQLAADAFNAEVVCLQTAEGASLGAAIQAAHATGENGSEIAEIADRLVALDPDSRCVPDADRADRYAEALEKQTALTTTLADAGHL